MWSYCSNSPQSALMHAVPIYNSSTYYWRSHAPRRAFDEWIFYTNGGLGVASHWEKHELARGVKWGKFMPKPRRGRLADLSRALVNHALGLPISSLLITVGCVSGREQDPYDCSTHRQERHYCSVPAQERNSTTPCPQRTDSFPGLAGRAFVFFGFCS